MKKQKNPDIVKSQAFKDFFLTPSAYRLDTRFVLRDGKKHPVAVICPGGGYFKVCSFIEGVPFARYLNERGISAVIVYYRVGKKAAYPAPQDDLARAVREVYARAEELNLDLSKGYSLWGSSAGGHLAASFCTEHMGCAKYQLPKPAVLILTYPVITMERELSHKDTHDLLIGQNASREREDFASVEKHVTGVYPPTYIWCGDSDKTVPPENTRRMAAALEKAGVRYKCEIFPGVDHGVGPGTGTAAQGWLAHAVEFWKSVTEA